jgi:hypothetical protein
MDPTLEKEEEKDHLKKEGGHPPYSRAKKFQE